MGENQGAQPRVEAALKKNVQFIESLVPKPQGELTYAKPEALFVNRAQRYVLVESCEGVRIIDLHREKKSFLTHYFSTHHQKIPTKTLLFPLSMVFTEFRFYELDHVLNQLASFGILMRYKENDGFTLLQQPAIISRVMDKKLVHQLILLVLNKSSVDIIASTLAQGLAFECIAEIPAFAFSELLEKWLELAPKTAFLSLTHQQLAVLFSDPLPQSAAALSALN
jgi:DNA mismatch repair ATPase MutL